ncbi:MAG: aspartate 1-decarboxylase [bacterium]|uniref:Aspartate 1-decarboxylase n=2 Tax=Bacteria candidate phyla TaxID=1783234 RepID=A0A101HZB1_UNCT6|nr:MAG: Aspartate 1-decarboxylase [candidate division TA06 bacterium 32_111]KUK86147.1 MAG: Aspartate 1-decarboxylase [candidate division TA06 bacterium 34_109]MDI6700043.1 aspartate 1-decarboxylase [bacterium]HAF06783.1 aspartate 1-decarboxylase [candidate division WOR-3 bacterium]HCP17109.1 aspartate 1-decarboxylase [candidate division WOR-3 bacterium]
MFKIMLKSKIHNAVVTKANVNYEGSIEIDPAIMERSDLLPNEKVLVINVENGERFETYVIKGKRNSKVIGVNGGAARLVQKGDRLIIMAFAFLSQEEIKDHRAKIVILDRKNEIEDEFTKGI